MVSSGTSPRRTDDGDSIAMGSGCRELTTDGAERIKQEMFRVIGSRGRATRLGNGYLAP
jgi:hypothetical protein